MYHVSNLLGYKPVGYLVVLRALSIWSQSVDVTASFATFAALLISLAILAVILIVLNFKLMIIIYNKKMLNIIELNTFV